MEKICGIYKITSPSGRVYIGQSINITRRKKQYSNGDFRQQVILCCSLKKYGWENHTFEILEECLVEELNCRERYWQDFYDVLNGGLNCILQGCEDKRKVYSLELRNKLRSYKLGKPLSFTIWNKGLRLPPLSEEWKQKISIGNKGKTVSEETRLKIGLSNKGKIMSEESKIKISNSHKGKIVSEETKARLSKVLLGKKKSETHRNNISISRLDIPMSSNSKQKLSKPVLQFTKNLIFIREWSSGKEVEDTLKISKSHISSCCNNKRGTAGGYIWKFKTEKEND